MTVFDTLRASCVAVMAKARYVRLDHVRLRSLAFELPLTGMAPPKFDARYHFVDSPEATAAFVLMLDAVNFGSGYFPRLQKRPGLSGYYTVALSLKEFFETHGPPAMAELRDWTAEDSARVFGQDLEDEARLELMTLFARAWRELSDFVHEHFRGDSARLVLAAEGSAERLVTLLTAMPMFRDVARYGELELPFLKRAQITVSDLALAFRGGGLGFFRDLDVLTVFADNLVPHVLRVDGVLHYDDTLGTRIARGELIEAGSAEEVEMRAAAVHAAELMVALLAPTKERVSARSLDYLLWNRGQDARYKATPRHRTRTIFY